MQGSIAVMHCAISMIRALLQPGKKQRLFSSLMVQRQATFEFELFASNGCVLFSYEPYKSS